MNILIFQKPYSDYENETEVLDAYPTIWSIKEVDGGWILFETEEDEKTWENQK